MRQDVHPRRTLTVTQLLQERLSAYNKQSKILIFSSFMEGNKLAAGTAEDLLFITDGIAIPAGLYFSNLPKIVRKFYTKYGF